MKKLLTFIILLSCLIIPVSAIEIDAPDPPESAEAYLPEDPQSFSEGLRIVLKNGIKLLQPGLAEASGVCLSVIAIVIFCSIIQSFSENTKFTVNLASAVSIGLVLLKPSSSMLQMGINAVTDMIEYGNLLLPVMTGAIAAEGGVSTAGTLYSATMLFGSVLSMAINKLIVPMIYIFVCLIISSGAVGEDYLKELQKFLKWLIIWLLKTVLYIFIGYIGITGVVSGTADAAAVRATKLTISGMIPVVGGIISDASETILVSAGVVKNSVGIYGLLVIVSVLIKPFIYVGIMYVLLKLTGSLCGVFGVKRISQMVTDFSGTMGIVLGMSGAAALFLTVSIMCFMKGIG